MRSSDFLIEIQKAKRKKKRKKTKSKSRRYGAVFYPYYGFGMSDSSDGGGDGGGLAEMAKPRALSDEQVKEIAEFWANGETFSELARVYKVDINTIKKNILRAFGKEQFDELEQQHLANTKFPEQGRQKGTTPEQVQQMAKLFASGITIREISRRIGIGHSNVRVHLTKLPNYNELEQQHSANAKYPEWGILKGITPEQSKEIYDLYIAGDKTLAAISDEFGIDQSNVRYHVSKIAKQLYGPDGYTQVRQIRKANKGDRKRLGPTTIRRTDTLVGPSREGPTRKRRGFKGPVSGGSGLMEMATRVLSDEQVKEIAEFWANGETFYELARVYKLADTNIKKNLLRVFGEKKYDELEQQHLANTKFPEKGRPKGITPEQVQQMAKLFASGITPTEIGGKFGIVLSNVIGRLNKLPNYKELEQQHLANTKFPEKGRPKGITPEQAKEIYDLYTAGDKTLDAIGDEFNLTVAPIMMHVSKIAKQLYGPDGYNKVKQERRAKIKDRKRLRPTTIRRTDTLVGPSREGPTRKGRGFKGPVSGGSGLMENQTFDIDNKKQTIVNFINQVLQGKTPNRQYNPFYEIITGTGKVGAANSLGLDKNLQTQWKTYFQSKPYIGGQGEPWSQININDQYSKNTGDDRTLNFYVTVNKNKDNILRFFKNFYKLSSYLKPISDQYKTPLKYKTHSLLDMFISHNDSFKVYYYDPKVKDLVVNATKKFLTDNGIETGARSHEHGTDVKSGGGSFGQILSNHIYDQFLNVIKTNGNKYTTDQYFQWLKQHWPTLISQVKQKEMTESTNLNSKENIKNEVKKFKNWACQRLSIKNPPKITLSYNTKEAKTGHHTGKHVHGSDSVWVYVRNRNLVDILRTVFHELVHWRQSELNMIDHGDSYPGSAIEAMADLLAGKYIKIYGKNNRNIFQ